MEWWRAAGGTRIAVLGPVVLAVDGRPAPLRSLPQRQLLCALSARNGRVVPADELIEALWGDDLPANPAAALQSQVSRLRARLDDPGLIETVGTGYRLPAGTGALDSDAFEALLAQARGEPAPTALSRLDEALGLWRGRAYLDLADQPLVRAEATRLDELRAAAGEDRAELLLALGHEAEAALAMQALEEEQPFRERCVALRMGALAQAGRQAEAVRAFAGFRRRLGEELGLEPSPGLQALESAILRHETGTAVRPAALALPGNSFVGREAEQAAAAAALGRSRLVTLSGTGGVGKTRLARHVAAAVAGRYPDGVHLCELAAVTDPTAVAAAVASALPGGSRTAVTATERVVGYLERRRALVVIDNCEHVLGAVAELVELILGRAPEVDVLATSRHRLGVSGEDRLVLGPLPPPDEAAADSAAVELFVDRATAVRPGLSLSDPSARAAVTELCRRLGGLPLAIELAAARCVARSPAEILDELSGRSGRLADQQRPSARHRSMDAVVEWSDGLLSATERNLFRRLTVFAGGFTADAAVELAGPETSPDDALDALVSLVEHSLLTVHDLGGHSRYSLLEPIREWAEARLRAEDGLEATKARHAAWAVGWAERADAGLRGPQEASWHALYEAELANLRVAHRWCLGHDPDGAVRLAALYWTAVWHGPAEVFAWADETVGRFGGSGHPLLPAALATAAAGAWRRNDLAQARALAGRGVELAGPDGLAGRFAWEVLGDTELHLGDVPLAISCLDRALELAGRAGDVAHAAVVAIELPLCLAHGGLVDSLPPAVGGAGRSLPDNPTCRAFADYVAGELRAADAPAEALGLWRRSLEAAREAGSRYLAGIVSTSALACSARTGSPAAAVAGYAELIERWHRAGAWNQQWSTILALLESLSRLGHDEQAAVLYGALTTSPSAARIFGADAARVAAAAAGLEERLGPDRLGGLVAHGASLGDDETVDYALRCVRTAALAAG